MFLEFFKNFKSIPTGEVDDVICALFLILGILVINRTL